MDVPVLVEKGVGIMGLIIGLSLIGQPKFWMDCVDQVTNDHSRALPFVYVGLPLGLAIVLLHNQWSWSPSVFVTVFGWLAVIKSSLFLLFPATYMRLAPGRETLRKIILIRGPLLVIIGVLILYTAYSK